MIVLWIMLMVVYQRIGWDSLYQSIELATLVFFTAINLLSTSVTIYAIFKIFATAKELASCYNKVKTNTKTMIIHSVLLTLNSVVVVLYVLTFLIFRSSLGFIRSGYMFLI
jgi:hypothetical protein